MRTLDLKIEVPETIDYDPFACFSGNWGGDTPVEEYCNELRYSGTQTREIEPW